MAIMSWSFLTNHAAVLLYLAQNPQATIREMVMALDLGKRTILRITSDLEREGYILKRPIGRRNQYSLNVRLPLRRPEMRHLNVGTLLRAIKPSKEEQPAGA